ncbi:MAG: hypothetical protein HN368_23735 [Spirochaetales bacterium]|jgi:predicted phosphodiesterase|nr:hypothetical protein [Spirochaetales bacterium]
MTDKIQTLRIGNEIVYLLIVGDLHSSILPLAEVDRLRMALPGLSKILVNGDIFPLGCEPVETLEWVIDRAGEAVVLGNHDEGVLEHDEPGQPLYSEAGVHELLSEPQLEYLSQRPLRLDITWKDFAIRLTHSHRLPDGTLRPSTSFKTKPAELCSIFGDGEVDLAVLSHTHFPFVRENQKRWVANTGSTSLPILSVLADDGTLESQGDSDDPSREPLCSFLLVGIDETTHELHPEIVYFDYDRELLIASLIEAGYPNMDRWRTLLSTGLLSLK